VPVIDAQAGPEDHKVLRTALLGRPQVPKQALSPPDTTLAQAAAATAVVAA
jgi:hypothetical protein